jgi:predicted alpha/beta superfamily hydrolase
MFRTISTGAFMKKSVACWLLVLASSIANAGVTTEFLQGLGDTRYHHVASKIVGRSYHIYVMLPDTYDESVDDKYPTIYLLDGGALFPLMSAYYRYLNFGEEIPDAIIVGISYGSDDFDGGNYRSTDYTAKSLERDFWGGAGQFQEFLSDELLPFVEVTYRSHPGRRVIFGHSIGGQFVLYTALTEPNLFWGYIASNPALHRNLPFFLRKHGESTSADEQSRLFVASGTDDDPIFREPALEWIEHWSDIEHRPWLLKTMNLAGHGHMSAPPTSFRQGMRWLFSED